MKNTKRWLKAAGIRAAKTVAQTAVALLPAAATIQQVDWLTVLGTAALAGVASVLTSLAGLPEVNLKSEGRWLKAAGIRAAKTVAQTAVALLPAAATIQQVDWLTVLGTAALAGVASVLTSLTGLPEVNLKSEGK